MTITDKQQQVKYHIEFRIEMAKFSFCQFFVFRLNESIE